MTTHSGWEGDAININELGVTGQQIRHWLATSVTPGKPSYWDPTGVDTFGCEACQSRIYLPDHISMRESTVTAFGGTFSSDEEEAVLEFWATEEGTYFSCGCGNLTYDSFIVATTIGEAIQGILAANGLSQEPVTIF